MSAAQQSLHAAAKSGMASTVAALLRDATVDPNALDKGGFSALHSSCFENHLECVLELVADQRVDVNRKGKGGYSALHFAAREGHLPIVETLLSLPPERLDADLKTDFGLTPLMLAAREGRRDVVRAFIGLRRGRIDPEQRVPDTGYTAFHFACDLGLGNEKTKEAQKAKESGQVASSELDFRARKNQVVQLLADSLPETARNARNSRGETPFLRASASGFIEGTRSLIESRRVDLTAVDFDGANGFAAACGAGHVDLVVDHLLTLAVSLPPGFANGRDRQGRTGLARAVIKGRHDLVRELLLLEETDPNLADNDGNTPFHHACRGGQMEMIKLFLDRFGRFDHAAHNAHGQQAPDLVLDPADQETVRRALRYAEDNHASKKLPAAEFVISKDAKVLGTGGFGEVVVGTFRGPQAAIKRSKQKPFPAEKFAEFLREVMIWNSVGDHANVLPLFGYCDDPPMIACPLAAADLLNYLWKRREQPDYWKLAGGLLRDVAAGLAHCHGRSIIHADLKPTNVLVFEDNHGKVVAKIADFGGSRLRFGHSVSGKSVIPVGTVPFQPPEAFYMAPELRASADRRRTIRARKPGDIYAFAMVCYQAATRGYEPFYQVPEAEIKLKVGELDQRPEPPSDMPKKLAELMKECWNRDPDKRPSMDKVVERMDAILAEL
ncbi:kinase-like domain-containing protein [Hyaloraphidium curvatum]|nr:kinase-like domain-containing protein [Hyaloraphidium curvatum]